MGATVPLLGYRMGPTRSETRVSRSPMEQSFWNPYWRLLSSSSSHRDARSRLEMMVLNTLEITEVREKGRRLVGTEGSPRLGIGKISACF